MVRSAIDVCLYTYSDGNGAILWCCVYVDDALLADNSPELRKRFVDALGERFPIEDKGELTWILNVSITRDRAARTLAMSQELYVSDMLTKFSSFIDESLTRSFDCPLEEGCILSPLDSPAIGSAEHDAMAPRREAYMSIVGGLLWLSNMTRPDLAYASSQLARFLTNPGRAHFTAAVRVLIYLRGSSDRLLRFTPAQSQPLEAYVDSNWAARFSCSGALVFFCGCLFHWFSKMQKSVSLSSAEAEYFGAMMAARELLFTRDLLFDLGVKFNAPTVIYSDSKSAVEMAFDPIAFKQTKHIMRAAEFLRDLVAREVLTLRHVKGTVMIADLLTKAVARAIFHSLMRLLDAYSSTGRVCPE